MKAIIRDFDYATDLLEHIVDHHHGALKTLIVCSTRANFQDQIIPTILTPRPTEIPPSQESVDEDNDGGPSSLPHHFLIPTLQLLSISRNIKLVYCPTIDSLRAYLSSYVAPHATLVSQLDPKPSLVILDLVLLHHATSEFSVQGLMRTFSSAISAASRNTMDLLICECRDVHDPSNPNRGPRLWDACVQLLSGSVRIGASFAGRTVSARKIASRWFTFENRRTDTHRPIRHKEEDEEMHV